MDNAFDQTAHEQAIDEELSLMQRILRERELQLEMSGTAMPIPDIYQEEEELLESGNDLLNITYSPYGAAMLLLGSILGSFLSALFMLSAVWLRASLGDFFRESQFPLKDIDLLNLFIFTFICTCIVLVWSNYNQKYFGSPFGDVFARPGPRVGFMSGLFAYAIFYAAGVLYTVRSQRDFTPFDPENQFLSPYASQSAFNHYRAITSVLHEFGLYWSVFAFFGVVSGGLGVLVVDRLVIGEEEKIR